MAKITTLIIRKVTTHRLGDCSVSVLVHVLEDLLQGSLLPHELPEGQAAVEVTIHPLEELLHLRPGGSCLS